MKKIILIILTISILFLIIFFYRSYKEKIYFEKIIFTAQQRWGTIPSEEDAEESNEIYNKKYNRRAKKALIVVKYLFKNESTKLHYKYMTKTVAYNPANFDFLKERNIQYDADYITSNTKIWGILDNMDKIIKLKKKGWKNEVAELKKSFEIELENDLKLLKQEEKKLNDIEKYFLECNEIARRETFMKARFSEYAGKYFYWLGELDANFLLYEEYITKNLNEKDSRYYLKYLTDVIKNCGENLLHYCKLIEKENIDLDEIARTGKW